MLYTSGQPAWIGAFGILGSSYSGYCREGGIIERVIGDALLLLARPGNRSAA